MPDACCAHLTVYWTEQRVGGGQTRGWWQCSVCTHKFFPADHFASPEEKKPHCCFVGCNCNAEFDIIGHCGPEDTTQACTLHVGKLLGSPVETKETNTHWTVSMIER